MQPGETIIFFIALRDGGDFLRFTGTSWSGMAHIRSDELREGHRVSGLMTAPTGDEADTVMDRLAEAMTKEPL